MDNMEYYNKLKSVPKEAKKQISAGRLRGFTSVNPVWREQVLTEVFGPYGKGWYTDYEIIGTINSEASGEMAVTMQAKLYVKYPGEKEFSIPSIGYGSAKILSKERSGIYFNDEAYKMAKTDAFGNAAKALGVAANVYFECEDTNKYNTNVHQDQELFVEVKPIPPELEKDDTITGTQESHLDAKLKENDKDRDGVIAYINNKYRKDEDKEQAESLGDFTYEEYCDVISFFKEKVIV